MQKIFIFPYNGNGIEAVGCLGEKFELVGFIDDTKEKLGPSPFGVNVYSREILKEYPNAMILLVPGGPRTFLEREKNIGSLGIEEENLVTVIHPSASISPAAKIGKNVLIMAGVVITSNAILEDHVCILPNTVIHHDVEIKSYTLVGSNVTIAGHVKIGRNCYIGSASSIINNISIADKTLIGMGSNVIRSIEKSSTVVGNPAKII